jgi:hypothetical protein
MPSDPGADAAFVELYDEMAASWATLEVHEDGFELAAQFARDAWTCGQAYALAALAAA